jgi:hypothetical protein
MEYSFIEIPSFTAHRDSCFYDDNDFSNFQSFLMKNPEKWPVIPGGGAPAQSSVGR